MATTAQSDDAIAAQRIGVVVKNKWTIEALLGVGGMAAVYAARHRNGQRAALKILHGDFMRDKGVVDRFLKEAYVSNKIGHPSCVRVLDDDTTEQGELFLVMELLEGETVRDLWKRHGRRVPVVTVLEIAERICDCLAACHAIGVIHRDLKPANIFITNEGVVKVLDFGVAQFHDAGSERTVAGTALGTPAYMSPEQAMGLSKDLDGRTDLFSVGAMIHALVTGQRINQGRTEAEALVVASTTPVPSVARIAPDLPIEVIQLIDRALAFDRRNRFTDAREMQQTLLDVLARLQGQPPPAPVAAPAQAQSAARVPAAGAAAAPPPPPVPQIPEDDPRVVAARETLKHVERLLPNVRQFGWDHPATDRSLRTVFDALSDALSKVRQPLFLDLRPYSILSFGHTAWEPGAPYDAIPYNLFACGMRALRVHEGIAIEELRSLLQLMMLDPGRDLPPEDDIVTAFWERALPHVEYDVADVFAEGDADARQAFYDESDKLEEQAQEAQRAKIDRIEAQAMAIATNQNKLNQQQEPSPMKLEDVISSAYANQLSMPSFEWSERVVDAIVDGLIDAATRREPQLVLGSLRKSSCDLLVVGRIDIVSQLLTSLFDRVDKKIPPKDAPKLKSALTTAFFGADALDIALKKIVEDPSKLDAVAPTLRSLPASDLPRFLAMLLQPGLNEKLSEFVFDLAARTTGQEIEIAKVAAQTTGDVRTRLLEILARAGARDALAWLATSEDPALRLEVRMLGGAEDRGELVAALDGTPQLRMAALRLLVRHNVRPAWPAVRRLYEKNTFHELGIDEKREILRAVFVLSDGGELTLIELAKKGGVFRTDARDGTRVAACEVLAELSRQPSTQSALSDLALARWGTGDDVRAAARAAADRIGQRLQGAVK